MTADTKTTTAAQLVASAGVQPSVNEAVDADAALMVRVAKGDDAAFTVLFDKHKRKIVSFARRYLGSVSRAEDATQETFLRLYRARADYRPDAKFTTYLYRIATNTCLNHLRQKDWVTRGKDGEDDALSGIADQAPTSPEQLLQGVELQRLIEKCFSELPEQQRTAFVLLRSDELSYEQIADVMQTTVPAVKALLNRAKVFMVQRLGPHINAAQLPYQRSEK